MANPENIFGGEKGDPFEYKDMGDGSYMFRDTRNAGSKFQLAKGGAVAAIDKLRKTGKSDWKAKAGGAPAPTAKNGAESPKATGAGLSSLDTDYKEDGPKVTATSTKGSLPDRLASIRSDAEERAGGEAGSGKGMGMFSRGRRALKKQMKSTQASNRAGELKGAKSKNVSKAAKADRKAAKQAYKDERGGIFTGRAGKIFEEGTENEGELLQEQAEMNRWKKIAGLNENKK
jgi:hypothetical protein